MSIIIIIIISIIFVIIVSTATSSCGGKLVVTSQRGAPVLTDCIPGAGNYFTDRGRLNEVRHGVTQVSNSVFTSSTVLVFTTSTALYTTNYEVAYWVTILHRLSAKLFVTV